MDNTRDLPGYKHYVDPDTGERPALYVAYLDLVPDPESTVNGMVFALDVEPLKALDSRERNYERHEMSQRMEPAVEGRVWVYLGTGAARERFERGRASGTAVINRPYLDDVRDGFAQLGPGQLERFDASTDPPPVPIRTLKRID